MVGEEAGGVVVVCNDTPLGEPCKDWSVMLVVALLAQSLLLGVVEATLVTSDNRAFIPRTHLVAMIFQ